MRVWLLGGFRVSVGSRSIGQEGWRLKKAGSVLKVLALTPGYSVHREQAMELLWPDLDPEAALNNLHHTLHVARRVLEPSTPASAASSYLRLGTSGSPSPSKGPLWVDVEAFEEAAMMARHAMEPAAYRAATDLLRGAPCRRIATRSGRRSGEHSYEGLNLSPLLEVAGFYEERKEFGEAIEALNSVGGGRSHPRASARGAHTSVCPLRRRRKP